MRYWMMVVAALTLIACQPQSTVELRESVLSPFWQAESVRLEQMAISGHQFEQYEGQGIEAPYEAMNQAEWAIQLKPWSRLGLDKLMQSGDYRCDTFVTMLGGICDRIQYTKRDGQHEVYRFDVFRQQESGEIQRVKVVRFIDNFLITKREELIYDVNIGMQRSARQKILGQPWTSYTIVRSF